MNKGTGSTLDRSQGTPGRYDYFAKGRFQSEEEARHRRANQGLTERRRTEWALAQIRQVAGGGLLFDLACGNGRHFEGLSQAGGRLIAGDYSEAMLGAAKGLTPAIESVPLVRLEAERLPFADKSFDGVFCARFFHHLPKREIREAILAEVFRTSRKVAVVTFKLRFSWEHLMFTLKSWVRLKNQRRYRYFISKAEFEEIAKAHGWRVTRSYTAHYGISGNCIIVMEPAALVAAHHSGGVS